MRPCVTSCAASHIIAVMAPATISDWPVLSEDSDRRLRAVAFSHEAMLSS